MKKYHKLFLSLLFLPACLLYSQDSQGLSASADSPYTEKDIYLNIKDFGALGDGKSDDTRALLAAIEEATKSEGTIYFPTGEYCIHPVKLPSHITLMGNSAWAYANKDKKDDNFQGRTIISALSGDARALFDLGGERGTRILGLTLDGRRLGDSMHGVYARNVGCDQYICIEDCRINNFSGSGIRLEKCWVFSIRRCLLMSNAQHGVDCTSGYDGWIIDNQLTANRGAGLFASGEAPEDMDENEKKAISFFGTASVMVTANRVEWNRQGGIILNGANSMQITGSSIDHNFGPGIMLTHSTANTISGNMVRSNGAERQGDMCSQVRIEDCLGTSVTGNTIWGWFDRREGRFDYPYPYYGIIIKNLTGCVISQNSLYHSSSKEGILDYGGHESTYIGENMYVKPDLEIYEGGFKLNKWQHLFRNEDVSKWRSDRSESFPEVGWRVEGDELIITGSEAGDSIRAGNLITREKFGNFEFSWEWKMLTRGGNSGVKYFVPGKGDDYSKYGPGPEYQLLDDDHNPWMLEGKMKPNDYHTLGACYELYEADSLKAPAPLGEWNSSRIVSDNGRIEHWLNGKKILEYQRNSDDFKERVARSKFKKYKEFGQLEMGHILLQDHPGTVHFRNIKIKTPN